MHRCAFRLLAVGSLLLCACGTEDGTVVGPVEPEQWSAAILTSLCDRVEDCCGFGDGQVYADQASCETALAPFFEGTFDWVAQSEAAGRIRWDAAAARTCINSATSASCEAGILTEDAPASCERVFVPLQQNAAECERNEECVSGLCSFATETSTLGRCAVTAEGEPCGLECFGEGDDRFCSGGCSGELRCESTFDGVTTTSSCEVRVEVGEGDSCSERFCDDGLWCNDDNVCEPERAAGATCTDDRQCSETCDGGVCTAEDVCEF